MTGLVTPRPVTSPVTVTASVTPVTLDAVIAQCERDAVFLAALVARLLSVKGSNVVPILGTRAAADYSALAPVLGSAEHALDTDHSRASHELADRVIRALPREGFAYSATFTAPGSEPSAFAATLDAFLSAESASSRGRVLAYAIVQGRRGREHVHAHGLLVVRSTRDWFALRSAWARAVGSADAYRALGGKLVTDWKAYRDEGDAAAIRRQLARDEKGETRGVIAYALKHGGDLLTGGSLASVALPSDPSRPLAMWKPSWPVTGAATCPVCNSHVPSARESSRDAQGATREPTCSPKCSAARRQRALRDRRAKLAPVTSKACPPTRDACGECFALACDCSPSRPTEMSATRDASSSMAVPERLTTRSTPAAALSAEARDQSPRNAPRAEAVGAALGVEPVGRALMLQAARERQLTTLSHPTPESLPDGGQASPVGMGGAVMADPSAPSSGRNSDAGRTTLITSARNAP